MNGDGGYVLIPYVVNTTTNATMFTNTDWSWKPVGRGRRFDRLARGLVRRLRIPFVRRTLWERDHPGCSMRAESYGHPWTSNNTLADFSFACTCHKNERYKRHPKHRAKP